MLTDGWLPVRRDAPQAVWHPALGKSVTGWGHTAVTYNGEKCVRQWHQGGAGYSVMEMMNPFPGTACVPTGC